MIRLDKFLCEMEIGTRSQVKDMVKKGMVSVDGEEGYPGNLNIRVTIGWEGNSLVIRYDAKSDQDTVVNFTNHSYFNLNGAGNGNINQHVMEIKADQFTLNADDCVPTGEIVPVEGTAMDFRTPKAIGRDADNDEPSVKPFGGYDSNFVISGHPVATTVGDQTGITMVTDTDQPGVQLYTGNFIDGTETGKDGVVLQQHYGFCLETQYYPDTPNQADFPQCTFKAGEVFKSTTIFKV